MFRPVFSSPRSAQFANQANEINASTLKTADISRPFRQLLPGRPLQNSSHRPRLVAKSEGGNGGNNLGDDMLDFLYAGKKLRKWCVIHWIIFKFGPYCQQISNLIRDYRDFFLPVFHLQFQFPRYGQEGQVLPRDGTPASSDFKNEDEQSKEDIPRDQVLVLDGDTVAMAEQVLLQLILARAKVKALVRDQQAAQSGFGPYIEVVGGNSSDAALVRKACRGVQAVVLCGDVNPNVLSAIAAAGVPHVFLLSAVGAPPRGGFSLFGGGEMAVLEDAKREDLVVRSNIPYYSIIRVGKLIDNEGGVSTLKIAASGGPGGVIAREDAALVLAQAAARGVAETGSLKVSVASSGAGQPPEDWTLVFRALSSQLAS